MMQAPNISLYSHLCPVDHGGTALQISGWQCDAAEQLPLVCLHDLGEAAATYRGAIELIASNGGSTYGFDMRGHGKGRAGAIGAKSIKLLQRDLLQVVALVKHHEQGEAPVILANGLSSVIAIRLALTYPKLVGGLILIDPPHPESTSVSRFRQGATKFLAEFMPDIELPARFLSARKIIRAQNAGSMAPAAAHELVEAVAKIPEQLALLSLKCLIIAATPEREGLWREEALSFAGPAGVSCKVVQSAVGIGSLPVNIISRWLRK